MLKCGGDEWEHVSILNSDVVKATILLQGWSDLSLLMKEKPAPADDEEGWVIPAFNDA